MSFPSFFDTTARITMHDPLAQFLGAAHNGLIEYSYTDVVKLAGHSCPTVAGAYLMTLKALKRLYGTDVPQRGDITVRFRDDQTNGVTGVIANVVGFITGGTTDNGFKGLAGKFDRRGLLIFNTPIETELEFQRNDTAATCGVDFHASVVPPPPELMPALHRMMAGSATDDECKQFGQAWQRRVEQILENADRPGLITCS